MNVAYFAIVKAISAAIGQPLVKGDPEDDVQAWREGGADFHTHYVASDGHVNVYCYNADFYSKLMAAVAAAMDDLRAYEIEVPNVRFEMVA